MFGSSATKDKRRIKAMQHKIHCVAVLGVHRMIVGEVRKHLEGKDGNEDMAYLFEAREGSVSANELRQQIEGFNDEDSVMANSNGEGVRVTRSGDIGKFSAKSPLGGG
jgi:hypothetical protein